MDLAIVAAHPDDEVIGMGALLPKLRLPLAIIHTTDGAPRSGQDARDAGCATWQEYSAMRQREFEKALETAGLKSAARMRLECPDQEAAWRIAELAGRLAEIFERLRPGFVFTHPYEGGHPDHDATVAAVHGAIRLLGADTKLLEFASYHAGRGGMECECFIGDREDNGRALQEWEREAKRELFNCFASQARVLAQFPLEHEPLRLAPRYDFSRAPHEGTLYYERFGWNIDPVAWRASAQRAFQELGIPCVC